MHSEKNYQLKCFVEKLTDTKFFTLVLIEPRGRDVEHKYSQFMYNSKLTSESTGVFFNMKVENAKRKCIFIRILQVPLCHEQIKIMNR